MTATPQHSAYRSHGVISKINTVELVAAFYARSGHRASAQFAKNQLIVLRHTPSLSQLLQILFGLINL